jgi:NADH-quinone oxidoreductase subunit M
MLLSALIFLPLFFVLLVVVSPEKLTKPITLVSTSVHFAFSLLLFKHFNPNTADLQLVEKVPWLKELGVSYFLAIDGISFWLVILTTFLTPIVVAASWSTIAKQVKAFHISILVLESAMIGSFLAFDTVLFYVFFELSLIPMYFIVGIWGGENRIYATLKFFIYTMVGSLLMLAGIIYLIFQCDAQLGELSASVLDLYRLRLPYIYGSFMSPQNILFFVFCLAFAIKVPMFPFHTWLPDAHVQAPTGGSMILAGVMLKMGTYGFLRFVMPMFPQAVVTWTPLFMALGVIGIIYGALVAMVQVDMKKLVAYSSVSHMGYVILGLFAMNFYGLQGSLFQMLAHGISTGALFMLVGVIYERTHSRKIADYGGLAKALPIYTICFMIITFSSIAVPMTNGFVGEFLILFGTWQASKLYASLAVLGVILGAAYMLWMVKKVFFGEDGKIVQNHPGMKDMNFRELATISPLIFLVFWMGLFPGAFLNYSKASINHLVENKQEYRLQQFSSTPQKPSTIGDRREF